MRWSHVHQPRHAGHRGLLRDAPGLRQDGRRPVPLPPRTSDRYYLGLTVHGVDLGRGCLPSFSSSPSSTSSRSTVCAGRWPAAACQGDLRWRCIGGIAALIPTFTNEASVLWTFYAPLQAHPAFYIGLTLIVVATWTAGINAYLTWRAWKREHPKERTPLMTLRRLDNVGHVGAGLGGRRRFDALPADPLVVRAPRAGQSPAQPLALLVYGSPRRLLLAVARIHLLVHDAPGPGGRQALQRVARAASSFLRLHPAFRFPRDCTTCFPTRASPTRPNCSTPS